MTSKAWKKPAKGKQKARNPIAYLASPSTSTRDSDLRDTGPVDYRGASAAVSGRTEIATEYDTPDRLSGYEALTELGKACEGREWRFVEVNVTYEVS